MKSNTFIFKKLNFKAYNHRTKMQFSALISMDHNFSFSITLEILIRSYVIPNAILCKFS